MLRVKLAFASGAAVGVATAYVLDPDRGRARRARLRDQLAAAGRRRARAAARECRYTAGRTKGRVMRSMGFGRFEPADDRALAQYLHGVLRRAKVPTGDLTLEVVDGVVRVRGEITDASDAAVVLSALACEPGVERIENLMHTRGQVAPNKAAGLQASAWAAGHR